MTASLEHRPATPPPQPWERQPHESDTAWQAFQLYRDTDGRRSAAKVAEQCRKAETLIRRWQVRWHWLDRAAAWDAELDREYRAEVLRERAKIARKHAQAAAALQGIAVRGLSGLDPTRMSARDLLDYMQVGMKAEASLYGLGGDEAAVGPRVRILINPALLPPGAVLPELE